MKKIKVLTILLAISLIFSFAYSQEKNKNSQTQPDKKENTFDPNKPTIIFYYNAKENSQKEFIQTATIGMVNLSNFAALDINEPENAKKLRSALSQFKLNGKTIDIVCVIGKNSESDVIIGTKDIAKYLADFFKYYANPEIFPNKPKLNYEKVETIADKFNELKKIISSYKEKFDEYKKLLEKAQTNVSTQLERKSTTEQLITLIFIILVSIIFGVDKAKALLAKKKVEEKCEND